MPNTLISCNEVDIFTMPEVDELYLANPKTQITIGDLHGNTIKLLFVLIKHGFVANYDQVSGAYAKLVDLYTKPWGTSTAQGLRPLINPGDITLLPTAIELEEFCTALDSITFKSDATVLLIGDELADRGTNDYYTLKLMQKLKKDGVKFDVLLSNHSIEFIEAYEKTVAQRKEEPKDVEVKLSLFSNDYHIDSSQTVSMKRLGSLIEHNLVTEEGIITLTMTDYLPSLKLLSYSINDERSEITIYSHATIGLALIASLAAKLGTKYIDTSIFDLAKTIEDINLTFQTFVHAGTIHTLYPDPTVSGVNGIDLTDYPVGFIAWNREEVADRPKEHNGYSLSFVHGHDIKEQTNGHIVNLDNILGMTNFNRRFTHFGNSGVYSVLYSANSCCELQATATELATAPQRSTSPNCQRFFQKPETSTPSTSNPSVQPSS